MQRQRVVYHSIDVGFSLVAPHDLGDSGDDLAEVFQDPEFALNVGKVLQTSLHYFVDSLHHGVLHLQ